MIITKYLDIIEERALKRAVEMVRLGLYNRFKENYDKRVEHAKIGCIGELAFEHALRDRAIVYDTDRENYEDRNADEFDFEINNYKIDVKVAKTNKNPSPSWTYGYPVQQIGMEKDFVIVGWVSEKYRRVGFYGWMRFEKIKTYPIKTKNTFAKFEYQTLNYEFPWGDLNTDFNELFNIVLENKET